jgi:trk system potassium uptake protein TrkA
MRVLIVGAGAVGFYLARRLADESHEVTLVDPDPDKVQRAQDNLDVIAIRGNGAAIPVLEEAGLVNTEIMMAVSGSDEVNLVACLVASKRGVPVKVARISHPEYHAPNSILSREDLGVDLMIGPEQECAWEAFGLLTTSAATELARLAGGKIQLVGMRVLPGAPVVGKSLSQLDREVKNLSFVVAAVVRGEDTWIPTGPTIVEEGDKIFVLGPSGRVRYLPTLAGHDPFDLRRVMIGGGSDEAVYLAQHLIGHGVHCTILESNRDRCRELAEILPGALVLHGDTTDLDLLEMEGVEGIDGFVALTNRDEVNMLAALLAKTCGARRSIPLIHKMEYMSLVERVGLDAAVSPRISAANAILRYVRRGPIASVAILKASRAEAMETVIEEGSRLMGRRLRDVKFPAGSLLGGIVRGEEVIMPRGGDALQLGDHAIFFVLPEAVTAVEKLLA